MRYQKDLDLTFPYEEPGSKGVMMDEDVYHP